VSVRAAIYARVSSVAQRDARTIESQLPACRELAARNGWSVVAEYVDNGVSAAAGNLERRHGLLRLLASAEAGDFEVVVTYDEDRLTRSDRIRERGYILGSLQEARVKIATVTKGALIDLDTDEGDLQISFGGLQSSSWLRKHKARIKAGKARAIAEGRKPAGPTPFGLSYDRASGQWSLHPENAPLVAEMFRRVADHESCEAIARDLAARGSRRPRGGQWIRERVYAIVRSRTYLGSWTADRVKKLVIPVPPVVSEEIWQRAQAALISHGRRGIRRVKHIYLLEGLAICGACGSRIGIRSANARGLTYKGTSAAYVCCARRRPARGQQPCRAPCAPIADVDARVWEAVRREIEDPALLEHVLQLEQRRTDDQRDWAEDARVARARLGKLERAEAGALRRYREDMISEAALDTELEAIRRHREMARQQLAAAERAQAGLGAAQARLAAIRSSIDALRTRIAQASPSERQEIVAALVMPGGAVLINRRVKLVLLMDLEAAASPGIAAGGALRVVQAGKAD
jgi:site-specific DNA recombinase